MPDHDPGGLGHVLSTDTCTDPDGPVLGGRPDPGPGGIRAMIPAKGRIAFTKNRGPHGKGHYMETENLGHCGRDIGPGKIMPEDWDPEDHQDIMCKKCLEWWRILHKPKREDNPQ